MSDSSALGRSFKNGYIMNAIVKFCRLHILMSDPFGLANSFKKLNVLVILHILAMAIHRGLKDIQCMPLQSRGKA